MPQDRTDLLDPRVPLAQSVPQVPLVQSVLQVLLVQSDPRVLRVLLVLLELREL